MSSTATCPSCWSATLGGRAALLASTEPGVVGAVVLNGYLLPGDESVDPAGRRLVFVHGTSDRIASYATARRVAGVLQGRADVDFLTVEEGRHAMLRHGRTFDRAAADFAGRVLQATADSSGATNWAL